MATNTILIRITGPDRPGITAALMGILAQADTRIDDIEQIVIRGRLILTLIVTVDPDTDLRADLLLFAYEQKVQLDFDFVEATPSATVPRLVVTLLGARIAAEEVQAIAGVLAANGANIDRIVRLAREPVMAYELVVSSDDRESVASALLERAHSLTCDIAVQRQGLRRRNKRMVFLDVDSTLIQDEVIELLAAEAGRHDEVAEITARAMAGELDFKESLTTRVAALAGLPESALDEVKAKVRLTPGAEVFIGTLHHLGYKTAIVSGGFTAVTAHLAAQLGIDFHHANELEIVDGVLTGRTIGPIVDRQEKATFLRHTAAAAGIPLDQVVAVGDGANDLDMLSTAGLGIAFNARPVVRQAADAAVNVPYLDAILFVLGFNRTEIEEAEATWRPPSA
ncbi:MAG: phosphoserine phosphatase SerB [Actinomycetota bacterium]